VKIKTAAQPLIVLAFEGIYPSKFLVFEIESTCVEFIVVCLSSVFFNYRQRWQYEKLGITERFSIKIQRI